MADIDVHDLARESLASAAFPAVRAETFRVHLAERVHQGVWTHASADTSHEICGVLVGTWARDADGPFALISEFIRCDNAAQKFAEVTFTHESWAQINGEMDTKYRDLRIIGWYHSHPNFGIFLSDRDCFIQEHFFSGPGQIALVVDPVRKIEGIFEWRRGKPTPIEHYWVENRIHFGVNQPAPQSATPGAMAHRPEAAVSPGRDESPLSGLMVLLIATLTLLLGYMYGGQRAEWERERLAEGAVVHFGLWKLYKPGFEEYLTEAITAQLKIADDLQQIAQDLPQANDETRAELEKKRQVRFAELNTTIDGLRDIREKYGLTDAERMGLLKLVQARVSGIVDSARDVRPSASAEKPTPKSKNQETKQTRPAKSAKSGATEAGQSESKQKSR